MTSDRAETNPVGQGRDDVVLVDDVMSMNNAGETT